MVSLTNSFDQIIDLLNIPHNKKNFCDIFQEFIDFLSKVSENEIKLIINRQDEEGNTIAHCLLEKGYIEEYEKLHKFGIDETTENKNSISPENMLKEIYFSIKYSPQPKSPQKNRIKYENREMLGDPDLPVLRTSLKKSPSYSNILEGKTKNGVTSQESPAGVEWTK